MPFGVLAAACGTETQGNGVADGGVPGVSSTPPSGEDTAAPSSAQEPDSTSPSGGPDSPDDPDDPSAAQPSDDVDNPDDPGSLDDPDSPGVTPNGPDDPAPTPVEDATPAAREFTRLTRREYQATVWDALGVEVDIDSLPVDGRSGVFTSNAEVTPDPVHPYLLVAEDLAKRAIPERLPACDGDVAECLSSDYAEPLTRLYRRAPSSVELANAGALIEGLLSEGASAEEATRAMLGAALLSPDFLFRASPANDASASARRLAERLSYALWDAPPDEELSAVSLLAEDEVSSALSAQVSRVVRDSRAVEVVARFLAQWLDVDTDRLKDDDASFAESPSYLELLALVEEALAEDVSVKELLTSPNGFVHDENRGAYPELDELDLDGDVTSVPWPAESSRRGLLGQDLFASSARHPDASRRVIFRGLLVRRSLLCTDIPAPSADLVALAGEVGDRTEDARCAPCHQLLDPIGVAFSGLDSDSDASPLPAEVLGNSALAGTYDDLPSLLDAIAESDEFALCFSRHFASFFLERPTSEVDPAWAMRLAESVKAGAGLLQLTEEVMAEMYTQSQSATPWCEGE